MTLGAAFRIGARQLDVESREHRVPDNRLEAPCALAAWHAIASACIVLPRLDLISR
jgi:hypothetical protein